MTCADGRSRWYRHLFFFVSPLFRGHLFMGDSPGGSWLRSLMALPKKGILSVFPGDELGRPYCHRLHFFFFSVPHPPIVPLIDRLVASKASSNPPPLGFLHQVSVQGPPRNDPTTGRSACARTSRLRAQFRPLDTHRVSPYFSPASVAMRCAHVLPVAARGEVLVPPQGRHHLSVVGMWVDCRG